MISTVSTVHAPSKDFKPPKTLYKIPDGTIAQDTDAWFTVKISGGCVLLANSEYWLSKYDIKSFGSNIMDYSGVDCYNSPYPTGTIVVLTQE